MTTNNTHKEYAVHVYENNPFTDGFVREIDVFSEYEEAKKRAKKAEKEIDACEHIEIIEVECDENDNELSRKFMTGWKAEESEMETIKLERTQIDREDIRRALKCLEDNGIEKSECPTVLQALGYILTDTELDTLFFDEDFEPRFKHMNGHKDDLYYTYIENEEYDEDEDDEEGYSVYMLVQDFGDRKKIKTYIETIEDDYLYWNSTEEIFKDDPNYNDNDTLLADVLFEMKENIEDVVRRRNYALDIEDMDNIIHRTTLDLE